MAVIITCHYGGYSIDLSTEPGKRKASCVVAEILSALFSVDEAEKRRDGVQAIIIDGSKIYKLKEKVTLQNKDVVVLLVTRTSKY